MLKSADDVLHARSVRKRLRATRLARLLAHDVHEAADQVSRLGVLTDPPEAGPARDLLRQLARRRRRGGEILRRESVEPRPKEGDREAHRTRRGIAHPTVNGQAQKMFRHVLAERAVVVLLLVIRPSHAADRRVLHVGGIRGEKI